MNIYRLWRDFMGFGIVAVVSAETEDRAVEIADWKIDENTIEIKVQKIGISSIKEELICEESL